MKPTPKQVAAEIVRLNKQSPHIPPSFFGDDNQAACRAQIDVLENGLDETAIYTKYDEPEDPDLGLSQQEQHQLDAALDARKWLDGELKAGPADGWAPIIKRATGLKL